MESDVVVFDSSAIIAYYIDSDSHHAEAHRIALGLHAKTSVLHPFVIQEVATVLTYRFSKAVADRFFEDIQGGQNLMIPALEIEKDIAFFRQAKRKMSFADLALIRLEKEMNAPLFTFDEQILSFLHKGRLSV